MDIKLIAVDIDGTLLNSKKQLTAATKEAIRDAAACGIQVAISTGRFLSEYEDLTAQLPWMRYTISCTGAQVIDLQTGKSLSRTAFTADQIRAYCSRLWDLDCLVQIFSDHDGKIHNSRQDLAHVEHFCEPALAPLLLTAHVAEDDLQEYVAQYRGLSNKIHIFFGNLEHRKLAMERFRSEPCSMLSSIYNDLELMPPGVDKGLGLQQLTEHLGLVPAQVMAIGDGGNDAAMLRYAGLGVAMANCDDEARAAADRVSPYTNDQDGVARLIRSVLPDKL